MNIALRATQVDFIQCGHRNIIHKYIIYKILLQSIILFTPIQQATFYYIQYNSAT